MGIDFADVLESCAVICEKLVGDPELIVSYDMELVAYHEVVDLCDGTEGTVLDGEDAELAKSGFDCLEYAVESPEIHDVCVTEDLVCGYLRVSALNALAGDHG